METQRFAKAAFTLCAVLIFFACSHYGDHHLEQVSKPGIPAVPATSKEETFVSLNQATGVADVFFSKQSGGVALRSAKAQKAIATTEIVKDRDNPLMYIINYAGGGWAIVSATRNFYPVLAYSDENSFELITTDMEPVELWLAETKEAIKASETLDDSTKTEIRSMWNAYTMDSESAPAGSILRSSDPLSDALSKRISQLGSMYGYSSEYMITDLQSAQSLLASNSEWVSLCNFANSLGSPPKYTIFVGKKDYPTQTVGPLLTTQWHQGDPYNYYCPKNIAGETYNAGCAAIAVAQVMKYHRHPPLVNSPHNNPFNWDNMPDKFDENTPYPPDYYSTPALIRMAANGVLMQWGVLGIGGVFSWAWPEDIEFGLRLFNYNVTRVGHNLNEVRTQILSYKRPVIMGGGTLNLPNPYNYLGNGHYWVCDGVNEYVCNFVYFMELINTNTYTYYTHPYIYNPANPFSAEQYRYLFFHMNWGWGGGSQSKDGWFLHYDVNSGNGNFQYGRLDFYISKP